MGKQMGAARPKGIRIPVPEEFGEVYTNPDGTRQWVERRYRIGRDLMLQLEKISDLYTVEESFKKGCALMSQVITDWDIEGDEGPLPKPWSDPSAFAALMNSDVDLSVWVMKLPAASVAELVNIPKN